MLPRLVSQFPATAAEGGCMTPPEYNALLEGYGLGQSYRFERCEGAKGRYCRVYPDRSFP